MSKKKRIWVDTGFSRFLKAEAATNGQSLLEYTKKIAERKNANFKKPLLPLW